MSITISKKQADEFALLIIDLINPYVEKHEDRYIAYLEELIASGKDLGAADELAQILERRQDRENAKS